MTTRGEADPKAEHAELVGRVRRFVADEVAPRAAGIDRENEFPGDVYRRMGEGSSRPSPSPGRGKDHAGVGGVDRGTRRRLGHGRGYRVQR